MSADHVYRAVQGRQRLESLLERVPLTSDYKARKVLHIAADRGLNSVLTSTCKVQGSNHFTLFIKTENYAGTGIEFNSILFYLTIVFVFYVLRFYPTSNCFIRYFLIKVFWAFLIFVAGVGAAAAKMEPPNCVLLGMHRILNLSDI